MAYQNTTNYSQRDINKKFNLVEFNKTFEKNMYKDSLSNTENLQEPQPNQTKCPSNLNTFFIIIFCIIIIGILLLFYNNFIIVN